MCKSHGRVGGKGNIKQFYVLSQSHMNVDKTEGEKEMKVAISVHVYFVRICDFNLIKTREKVLILLPEDS